jgi:hypothetical protein
MQLQRNMQPSTKRRGATQTTNQLRLTTTCDLTRLRVDVITPQLWAAEDMGRLTDNCTEDDVVLVVDHVPEAVRAATEATEEGTSES